MKRIKTALAKKQQQEALALPVFTTSALSSEQTTDTTANNREKELSILVERELATMKDELLAQMSTIAKSINERSKIDSVGQIAAMIKWDIQFDAGKNRICFILKKSCLWILFF